MNANDILITPCCYCGTKEATTRDHVPPKAIFNKPRPDDLITVPCCFECNNQASSFDEKFKAYLGMHIARQGGERLKDFLRKVCYLLQSTIINYARIFSSQCIR